MAEVTDRDYAEAEKWIQGCPVCEGMEGALAKQIAAYRESCVAESEAARLKAEGERDRWKRNAECYANELGDDTPVEETHLGRAREEIKRMQARLRAVIEALQAVKDAAWTDSDHCALCGEDPCASGCVMHAVRSALRDAQASPEPEASKQACTEFKWRFTPDLCVTCGLPWSQHGGRDAR